MYARAKQKKLPYDFIQHQFALQTDAKNTAFLTKQEKGGVLAITENISEVFR